MPDWYTTVSDVADRLAYTAKSSYAHIHDSLSDLTAGIDSTVFNVASHIEPPPVPPSQWELVSAWVIEHKYAIAAVSGATGLGVFLGYRQYTKRHRKRRAARTGNASRKEVLIITNFSNALSRSLALDLERRGFIVFCTCQSSVEALAIENEGHSDIRPLLIGRGTEAYSAIEKFGSYLSVPAPAYHGGHTMHFAGLVLAPCSNLPNGPLEAIDLEHVESAIDSGLKYPVSILQYFLPLLRQHSGRIIFLNEWIIPTLHTPFYSPQVITAHSIRALARTISREVPSLFTIHMRLGTFDIAQHYHISQRSLRADILNWSPSLRAAYSSNFRATKVQNKVRGTAMKELHYAVFDALTDVNPGRDVQVGAGVRMYGLLSSIVPDYFMRWLLAGQGEEDWEVLDF